MMLFSDEGRKLYLLFFVGRERKPLLVPLASSYYMPHQSVASLESDGVSKKRVVLDKDMSGAQMPELQEILPR